MAETRKGGIASRAHRWHGQEPGGADVPAGMAMAPLQAEIAAQRGSIWGPAADRLRTG